MTDDPMDAFDGWIQDFRLRTEQSGESIDDKLRRRFLEILSEMTGRRITTTVGPIDERPTRH
ncbi:MAG TPA: hypothetical protein VK281_03590 [Xanthobacteraceae bacterium]|nr:hypothetical protein [Xanthobacteraceae bacterium]